MCTYGTKYPNRAVGMASAQMTYFLRFQMCRLNKSVCDDVDLGGGSSGLNSIAHPMMSDIMAASSLGAE